jgi:hypothetical protein
MVQGTLRLDPKHPVELPRELAVVGLDASGCEWLRELPKRLHVKGRLTVSGCVALRELPAGMRATSVVMRGCRSIQTLPEGLSLSFLDASDCTAFARWPQTGAFSHGHLVLRNCINLRTLPPWIESVARLDLAGCAAITEIPATLRVTSFIDVAGTGIRALPPSLAGTPLRIRGAPVDERVAFRPETITAAEVLGEANIEIRRAKLAQMGYERFVSEANADVLDEDRDPGGERRLFRIALGNDEPLVCLAVVCPSTARRYVIRVPPHVARCHAAAAWIAGFDDPAAYAPALET